MDQTIKQLPTRVSFELIEHGDIKTVQMFASEWEVIKLENLELQMKGKP